MVETMETSCIGVTPTSCPMASDPIDDAPHFFTGRSKPARLARQLHARALAKAEVANVLVEAVRPHLQRQLHGGHVA